MISQFNLSAATAKAADEAQDRGGAEQSSSRISQTGEYKGIFTKAYVTEARDSRAEFMNFEFTDTEGDSTRLRLTLRKRNGEDNFGMSLLHAILTVFRIKSVKGQKGTEEDWQGNEFEVMEFPQLCGKQIGLLLQRAPWKREGDGKEGFTMELVKSFDVKTRQSASEILGQLPPDSVDSRLKWLKDKPVREIPANGNGGGTGGNAVTAEKTGINLEADDDVPF